MSKTSIKAEESLQICDVCNEAKSDEQTWFLLAENAGEDKLQILAWDAKAANRAGMYCACSPTHVQEMVIHWMTCGSLDVAFAVLDATIKAEVFNGTKLPWRVEANTNGLRVIGELMIDRASVARILEESPESLQTILDELSDTLQGEAKSAEARFESAAGLNSGMLRQV